MKSTFQAHLVNSPYGDPALYVRLRWQGEALLFDLGRIDRLEAGALMCVTGVFVSHTHMDHFIGFDRLLRVFLAREARLRLFGPPGLIDNVRGKLAGYTWNLVDDYPLTFEVTEASPRQMTTVRLRAAHRFAVEPVESETRDTPATLLRLVDEPGYRVDAVQLDHKIPCLAFRVHEATHLNVDTTALGRFGVPPGAWLSALKAAVRADAPPDTPITLPSGATAPLHTLRADLLIESPGQRIVYVTDARFSPDNIERILMLAHGADLLVCETPFLEANREHAEARAHLTARQAGALARWAGVRHLQVFHFSARHEGAGEELRREAEDEFTGRETVYGQPAD